MALRMRFLSAAHHVIYHADALPRAPDVWINTLQGIVAEQAPSSVYRGEVCFFDSIEHRDMFEANHHRPVGTGAVPVAMHEQHGRRIQRQGSR